MKKLKPLFCFKFLFWGSCSESLDDIDSGVGIADSDNCGDVTTIEFSVRFFVLIPSPFIPRPIDALDRFAEGATAAESNLCCP